MRVFEKPNLSNDWKCPICGSNTKAPVTLIGLSGTEDGNTQEALQVHIDCIQLETEAISNDPNERIFSIFMYYKRRDL